MVLFFWRKNEILFLAPGDELKDFIQFSGTRKVAEAWSEGFFEVMMLLYFFIKMLPLKAAFFLPYFKK